jgi:C4-type Zn-finger protein
MSDQTTEQLTEKQLKELQRLKATRMALDELKKKGIFADIIVCPVCKSPRIQELTSFSDLGYIGSFQPMYFCRDCGWYGRLKLTMSNKPLNEAILEDMKEASLDQEMEEYLDGPDLE